MKKHQMSLMQEKLRTILRYEPASGKFFWRESSSRKNISVPAGWMRGKDGRRRLRIFGKDYYASRVAWFYIHGEWHDYIDHINNNPTDDRIENLRPANNSQNNANRKAKSDNRLGLRGIGFDKSRNKFYVFLQKEGRRIQKRFPSLEEAKDFAASISNQIHGEFSIYSRS